MTAADQHGITEVASAGRVGHFRRRRLVLAPLDVSEPVHPNARSVLLLPPPRLVLRHAVPVVLESVVAPLAAYYCAYMLVGFRGALVGALAWSYSIVARHLIRRERVTTLMLLGTALLTMRTIVAFATGSAFLYFIQPTAMAFLAALLLLSSALVGRPFTQRFTHDFCPLSAAFLARPTTHRFFVRVSFLWAVTMLLNGAIVLTLLLEVSTKSFALERSAVTLLLTGSAVALSIAWFTRAMRRDGITVNFGIAASPLAA